MKLLGSGPDMVAELKDGDKAEEVLREGFLREFWWPAAGFWELLCLVAGGLGGCFKDGRRGVTGRMECDLKKLLWQVKLNPRVRCAVGNV